MKKNIQSELNKEKARLKRQIAIAEKQGYEVDENIKKIAKTGNIRQLRKIDNDMIYRQSTIEVNGKKKTGKEIIKELQGKYNISVLESTKLLKKGDIETISILQKTESKGLKGIEEGIKKHIEELKSKSKGIELERLEKITNKEINETAKNILKNVKAQAKINKNINEKNIDALKGDFTFGGYGGLKKMTKKAKEYDEETLEEMNRLYKENVLTGLEHIMEIDKENFDDWLEIYDKIYEMDANEVFQKIEHGTLRASTKKTILGYKDLRLSSLNPYSALLDLKKIFY